MLNPQHTVHITINEKLCVKSVLMVSGAALPRDVDMNPSASQRWITLSKWPTYSPAALASTIGGHRKIMAARASLSAKPHQSPNFTGITFKY